MTTSLIPAEHLAKLKSATDEQLLKVAEHNQRQAARDWAAGNYDDAKRWYAYVDTCQTILEGRRNTTAPSPKPATQRATERQVNYIAELLVRQSSDAGFVSVRHLRHPNGNANLDAIRALSKAEASRVIDSLRETY